MCVSLSKYSYTHLFPPRHIQGNKSGQDPRLSKQLTSHVRCKLLIITDVQVLHRQSFTQTQTIIYLVKHKQAWLVKSGGNMLVSAQTNQTETGLVSDTQLHPSTNLQYIQLADDAEQLSRAHLQPFQLVQC